MFNNYINYNINNYIIKKNIYTNKLLLINIMLNIQEDKLDNCYLDKGPFKIQFKQNIFRVILVS